MPLNWISPLLQRKNDLEKRKQIEILE